MQEIMMKVTKIFYINCSYHWLICLCNYFFLIDNWTTSWWRRCPWWACWWCRGSASSRASRSWWEHWTGNQRQPSWPLWSVWTAGLESAPLSEWHGTAPAQNFISSIINSCQHYLDEPASLSCVPPTVEARNSTEQNYRIKLSPYL